LAQPIILVLDRNITNIILDNSPDIFDVGLFKRNFFKSFMTNNVGIQHGVKWRLLRSINENVLDFGRTHQYTDRFNEIINNSFTDNKLPLDFYDFNARAKEITGKIVFGTICPYQKYIYNTFTEANKLPISILHNSQVPSYDKSRYYIDKMLRNPQTSTLTYLLAKYGKNISNYCKQEVRDTLSIPRFATEREVLADQIYHFIFPIVAMITIHVPRILALIFAHPKVKSKLFHNLPNSKQTKLYIRKCILETLRLNSPVMSFFRKSSRPVFGFPKNTEFLILSNPMLRDPLVFPNPDLFIPDRWTEYLEQSQYNLIFGLGPQRCPGKNLAMHILQYYLHAYIIFTQRLSLYVKNEDILYIQPSKQRISYYINPYKIILCALFRTQLSDQKTRIYTKKSNADSALRAFPRTPGSEGLCPCNGVRFGFRNDCS